MKVGIIYSPYGSRYRHDSQALVAKNGKWITLHGCRSRVKSVEWGATTPEVVAEARVINELEEEIARRRRKLNNTLKASQAELLLQAAAEPEDVKPKPIALPKNLPL